MNDEEKAAALVGIIDRLTADLRRRDSSRLSRIRRANWAGRRVQEILAAPPPTEGAGPSLALLKKTLDDARRSLVLPHADRPVCPDCGPGLCLYHRRLADLDECLTALEGR